MTKRRSARLLEKEERIAKRLKYNGPLLHPRMRDPLHQIVSYLDPRSFVRLARTCKEMNYFCLRNKRIRLPFWKEVEFEIARFYLCSSTNNILKPAHSLWMIVTKQIQNKNGTLTEKTKRREISEQQLEKRSKMPFTYKFRTVTIRSEINRQVLTKLRQCFGYFPGLQVEKVCVTGPVKTWDLFLQFLQEYNIVHLAQELYSNPPAEIHSIFKSNLSSFYCKWPVPDEIIVSSTVKTLNLRRSFVSKKTFQELIRRFVSGAMLGCRVGCLILRNDLLMESISEVMKTIEVEAIEEEKMDPSVIYFTKDRPEAFFLRKKDGSLGSFIAEPGYVAFG